METTLSGGSAPPELQIELDLPIEGMTCASCVNRVERFLRKADGVVQASVNLATEQATVRFDPSVVGLGVERRGIGGRWRLANAISGLLSCQVHARLDNPVGLAQETLYAVDARCAGHALDGPVSYTHLTLPTTPYV